MVFGIWMRRFGRGWTVPSNVTRVIPRWKTPNKAGDEVDDAYDMMIRHGKKHAILGSKHGEWIGF